MVNLNELQIKRAIDIRSSLDGQFRFVTSMLSSVTLVPCAEREDTIFTIFHYYLWIR